MIERRTDERPTGLPAAPWDPTSFESRLSQELQRASRQKGQFTLLLCALDVPTDRPGFALGGASVRRLAVRLMSQARRYDVVAVLDDDSRARWGGAHCAILLCDVDSGVASRVCQRMQRFARQALTTQSGLEMELNLRTSMASFPQDGHDGSALVQAAVKSLQRSPGQENAPLPAHAPTQSTPQPAPPLQEQKLSWAPAQHADAWMVKNASNSQAQTASAQKEISALVVDPEAAVRDIVSKGLSEEGLRWRTAQDFAAACGCIDESPVDLLVCAHHLPDGDAFALVEHMRERAPHARAVVCVERGVLHDINRVQGWDVVDLLAKPFDLAVLHSKVQAAVADLRSHENDNHVEEDDQRPLIEAIPEPIVVYDPQSAEILEFNRAAEELYGFSRAQVLGQSMLGLSEEDSRPSARWQTELHRHREGHLIPVETYETQTHSFGRLVRVVLVRPSPSKSWGSPTHSA